MFGFVHICQRHQQIFADAVARAGCTDPGEIAKVRAKLFAWFSAKYPMLVLEHYSNAACVGCTYEKNNFDKTEIYDAMRVIVLRVRTEASATDRNPTKLTSAQLSSEAERSGDVG